MLWDVNFHDNESLHSEDALHGLMMDFWEWHFRTNRADEAVVMNDCRLLVNISDYIHPDDDNECWLDNNEESIGAFPPKLLNFLDGAFPPKLLNFL